MSYDITFYTFQNSYKGSIILQYGKNGASLQFVPVFQPISPKDIKPGVKVYNYDESKWFTMTPDEMIIVRQVIPALIQNGLQGINYKIGTVEVSEKYGISITHFPQNAVSRVNISRFPDNKDPNKMHYMIKFTLQQNNQTVFELGLEVGSHGLLLFNEYLQQEFNYITSYNASMRAIYDANKAKQQNQSNGGYNNKNNSYNNSNGNNSGNNSGNYNRNANYNNNSSNYNNSQPTTNTNSQTTNTQPQQNVAPSGSVASLLG